EYELTEAGRELRPVLTALRTWGDKWAVDAPPAAFTHSCGHDLDAALVCRHCGGEVHSDDLELRVLAPGWTREGPVTAGGAARPGPGRRRRSGRPGRRCSRRSRRPGSRPGRRARR